MPSWCTPHPRQLAQPNRNLLLHRPEKGATPNDFLSLSQPKQRLLDFQKHYQQTASPFQWTFTRKDLNALLAKLSTKAIAAAAA
jgi:hypothetical protein